MTYFFLRLKKDRLIKKFRIEIYSVSDNYNLSVAGFKLTRRTQANHHKRKKMSLLDTLKNLICSVVSKKPESEPEQGSTNSDEVIEKATEVKVAVEKVVEEKVEEVKAAVEEKVEAVKAAVEKVAEVKPEPVAKPAPASSVASETTNLQIPEDSTLKRHFVSILKAEIESELPPRPTDSTLKRHYDAKVQAELDDLLG